MEWLSRVAWWIYRTGSDNSSQGRLSLCVIDRVNHSRLEGIIARPKNLDESDAHPPGSADAETLPPETKMVTPMLRAAIGRRLAYVTDLLGPVWLATRAGAAAP